MNRPPLYNFIAPEVFEKAPILRLEPPTTTTYIAPYVPTNPIAHPPIHQTYLDMIGAPNEGNQGLLVGYGAPARTEQARQLGNFLGIDFGEPVNTDANQTPTNLVMSNAGGWPLEEGQRGFISPYDVSRALFAQDRPPPPLVLMYTDPGAKGAESYGYGPNQFSVNGDYLENPNGYSLVINANPDREYSDALHSYAHNWENALQQYRPDVYQFMNSTMGSVHGPKANSEYDYGDEGQGNYLERWLSTAANMVGSEPFVGGDGSPQEPVIPLPEEPVQTDESMMYS